MGAGWLGGLFGSIAGEFHIVPAITLNRDGMWPEVKQGEYVQYVVIQKLRIANCEERRINLVVRLRLESEVNSGTDNETALEPYRARPDIS